MGDVFNAIVESVSIDDGDRGLLTAWLHLKYGGGSGQGFGGFTLYLPESYSHHTRIGANYAGVFIHQCMRVAGVPKWQDIPGMAIRVEKEGGFFGSIRRIGHITEEIWFCPEEEFAAMKAIADA